ncbi:peptidyl-prolyl cis-trans isomerase G-like [Haliotis rufescens]|uniref:peptidyl-prolyl cis-trans isomerase G-like n=1 Tax=Haliotis rufescens TaxID=6454 RepID=UPI001EAFF5C4|nr:peptidyl-prolyl cis-trans isomerase G-like [Haliotis rufescens]
MASDEEDEELAALRFAALASMKNKQKPVVEEDEDLKALKEAALRTLEKTLVNPHVTSCIPPPTSISAPTHLQPVQCHSPNYYSSQPPAQYVHNQYSQPPSNYQQVHNVQSTDFYHQHNHHPSYGRGQASRVHPSRSRAHRRNVARGGVSSIASMTNVNRSNTPPGTASRHSGAASRASVSRGNASHGNAPRGLPPRGTNLIVISPMPMQGEASLSESRSVDHTLKALPKVETSKPMLLRPQDKWCSGTSDSNSMTASPSRPKASGKFSRFDTSSSESEEESDENEEERIAPLSKSSDKENESDRNKSDTEIDNDKSSDSDSDSSLCDYESDKSKDKESASDDSASDESDTKGQSENERKDDLKSDSDVNLKSETEEEKHERLETDRLLEETMDRRQVLSTSSEKEDESPVKWTTKNILEAVTSVEPQTTCFDLSQKLAHHRAKMKEENGNDKVAGDLSEKLTNRRNRPQDGDLLNSPTVSVASKEYENSNIQKVVEDVEEVSKTNMSANELKRLEARKRKFEGSPVSGISEVKKTISLKGIVPRSKKRQKEHHKSRSVSPVPKRYSKDFERYEKRKASKTRRKSGSKENHEVKPQKEDLQGKDRSDCKTRSRDKSDSKFVESKKIEVTADESDDSRSDVDAQISDSESDGGEGRAWRKRENKNRIGVNRDRSRPVRDTLERFDRRRDHHGSPSTQHDRIADRRRQFRDPRKDVVPSKHRRGGGRQRSVELLGESESDSDGPRLPSSIVMPNSKQNTDHWKSKSSRLKESNNSDNEDSDSELPLLKKSHSDSINRRIISSDVGRRKQNRRSRKVTTAFDDCNTVTIKTNSTKEHSERKAKFESRDRNSLSVTVDSDKDVPSRSRASVHDRLGRQLHHSDSESVKLKVSHGSGDVKQKNAEDGKNVLDDLESKERKQVSPEEVTEDSPQADDELERRIRRIKEKNAAILKRQEEVRQDKERYG